MNNNITHNEVDRQKSLSIPGKSRPSTLEAVGNFLSLPSSSALDGVAGKNPFDQWLDPFGYKAYENRTTDGREALRAWGLAGDKDTWGNFAAGTLLEVATDPLNLVGIGVATKAGKVASKAGLLQKGAGQVDDWTSYTNKTSRQLLDEADDIEAATKAWRQAGGTDDLLDKPVGSLLSFGTKNHQLNVSPKPIAKIADKAVDTILDIPGMRNLRAAFSPRVLNAVTKGGQSIAEHRSIAVDDALVDLGYRFSGIARTNDIKAARDLYESTKLSLLDSGLELDRFELADIKDVNHALRQSEHLTRAASMAHAASELLGTSAKQQGGGVPMMQAIKRLGMDTPQARRNIEQWAGQPIDNLSIDESLLADAGRFIRPFTEPQTITGVRAAVESFNRLFKTSVTMPWPAFHVRNLFSGQLQNALFGAIDPTVKGPTAFTKPIIQSHQLRNGKTLKNISREVPEYRDLKLSDKAATELLRDELFAHNLIGDWQNAAEVLAKQPSATSRLPGSRQPNPLLDASLNPFDAERFIPNKIGGRVAQEIEGTNRVSAYISLRKQGYTPDAAAKKVKEIQIDYADATLFEQKYAKNIIPFWMFSARMAPLAAKELLQHPGGPMAQSVKIAAKSDRDENKPHWLRGTTSLPLNGTHYFGLPGEMHADAVNFAGAALTGDKQELASQLGGRINPLLKYAIESGTGRDLYLQRPLETAPNPLSDLTGQELPQTVEHIARNSPFARYLSSAAKVQRDRERAALNLATGLSYVD